MIKVLSAVSQFVLTGSVCCSRLSFAILQSGSDIGGSGFGVWDCGSGV